MYTFTTQKMAHIIPQLTDALGKIEAQDIIEFEVLNPDLYSSYNGNIFTIEGEEYIFRGYKSWLDLAQLLQCKMLTPKVLKDHTICIRFQKLNNDSSFHKTITNKEEKYGQNSIFSQIHKNEESSFIYYYLQALKNVKLDTRLRILNLGVNSGDEFEAILSLSKNISNLELVGIDYCPSAINKAKVMFTEYKNISFYTHDINDLESLDIGKFDLIISIGTLQSSNLEFNPLLMSIVQNQLKQDGAMILGFPNCRWIDGEMIYGAKVKNYAFSEMGLLYKDVIFSKKYLQQKKYRVTITGKDYIFLTATSICK
ncbi:MAG TPA: methyltransferase domain-containing protein [Sulfurimonas sp.]|nr:methyltransferase domain-containing protein [Sulfurimonas sp.]HIM75840.1 methyltransferase domain-containing protein [Campylobacterales bacterium]